MQPIKYKSIQLQIKIFIFLIVFCSCNNQDAKIEKGILIQNINIIDAKNGLQETMDVVIIDDRIQKVSTHRKGHPKFEKVINGEGKYMIPGLWDAHVHFAFELPLAPAMFDLFLVNGVTSVRDTGGKLELVKPWKEKSLANPNTTPRVTIAGPLLDGVPVVYDGSSAQRPPLGTGAANPKEGIALVEKMKEADVDLIKSYEMLSPETFKAIAKKANEYNLKLTGHVPLSMDVISASNAGLNSMEHLRNLEMSIAKDADKLLEQRKKMLVDGKNDQGGVLRSRLHTAQRMHAVQNQDVERREEVLNTLAKNDTWQIPTLTIATAMNNAVFTRPEWRENYKYLPDTTGRYWMERSIEVAKREINQDAKDYAQWAHEMVKHLADANVGIMAGTDCPIFFLTPGFSLHEELILLEKSGLTPLQVLETATLRPAQYFNLEKELGTIETGKIADLVILNENPLDQIKNTQKIEMVIKNGNLMNRQKLDKMLSQLENN